LRGASSRTVAPKEILIVYHANPRPTTIYYGTVYAGHSFAIAGRPSKELVAAARFTRQGRINPAEDEPFSGRRPDFRPVSIGTNSAINRPLSHELVGLENWENYWRSAARLNKLELSSYVTAV
jgi:hypothetical protein